MKSGYNRRQVLEVLAALPAATWLGCSSGCTAERKEVRGDEQIGGSATGAKSGGATEVKGETKGGSTPKPARKSASSLTAPEISRFKRVFEEAVRRGRLDVFCDEHGNHHAHHMHGADVGPQSPLFIKLMMVDAGHRLLPWHRAFILEAEAMLREVERDMNATAGAAPAETPLLIPYWDAAHDQALPKWVDGWLPQGGTAKKDPELPNGHPGKGPSTERYTIRNCRWPGTNPAFPELPSPEQMRTVLQGKTFVEFYRLIDFIPYVVPPKDAGAKAALDAIAKAVKRDERVMRLMDLFANTALDNQQIVDMMNAAAHLGWQAAAKRPANAPDPMAAALSHIMKHVKLTPHATMHLWAAGLDPENRDIRGTVSYFHELAIDPLFFMLHAEIDRLWYSWQEHHTDAPPLEGDHAKFQPLQSKGGRVYELAWLNDRAGLPYTYDTLLT